MCNHLENRGVRLTQTPTFSAKGRIGFYEEGVSEDFMEGGAHFFPNLKRGGHIFFQSLILNIFS